MNAIHSIFYSLHVFDRGKNMTISLYLVLSKYTKIHKQEIPSLGYNVLEFFCVLLHTEFLSNIYKEFHVAFSNVEYPI